MKKEEKIKEAWGVYFEHLSEHATKHALENDVFCYVPVCTLGLILRKYGEEWLETNKDLKNRPKSLKGIENNNGWQKIESEADLPEIGTYCHFIIKGFEELDNQGLFDGMFWDNKCAYISSIVTHYQPIIKPAPPIY